MIGKAKEPAVDSQSCLDVRSSWCIPFRCGVTALLKKAVKFQILNVYLTQILRSNATMCANRGSQSLPALIRSQKIVILHIGKLHERCCSRRSTVEPVIKKTRQRDIEFKQCPANAAPAQAFVVSSFHQTARRTIMSLILPIALVGFKPFGQTSTQFMMVWQRNRRYGSSRLSRRSLVAWSRVSAMKR